MIDSFRYRPLALMVLATLFLGGFSSVLAQGQNSRQKKVLVLYLMRRDGPSTEVLEGIFQKALREGLDGQLDYYAEYVDLARFAGSNYQSTFRDFLKRKYLDTDFDVIIANGDLRNFLARYRADLFPNTPVVFSLSEDGFDKTRNPSNFTGVVRETDLRATLEIILKLQPGVRRVFVVTGASPVADGWHEARARRQFKEYEDRFTFTWLSGLPMDKLKERISNLPPDSVVYFITMVEDGAGTRFAETAGL